MAVFGFEYGPILRSFRLNWLIGFKHYPNVPFNKACNIFFFPFQSLRYQQSRIRVFSKFLAQDPDSGRTEYFPSRSTELDVTELVMGHGLRISNSGVASLRNDIVQGLSAGRTEIKVCNTT